MPREDGYKNLVPMDKRSVEEARSFGQAGGYRIRTARRRKRSLKEAADLYLSLPVTDRRKANKLLRRQVDPEDIDNQMAMIAGLTDARPRATPGPPPCWSSCWARKRRPAMRADTLARAAQLLEGIDSAIE